MVEPDESPPGGSRPAAPADADETGRRREKHRLIRYAAYRCFAEQGYQRTTVDTICKQAGISKGSFYWHFDSKKAVFLDILETWAQEVELEVAEQFRDAIRGTHPLRAVTQALEREAGRGRQIMAVWLDFVTHAQRDPAIRAGLADFHLRIRGVLVDLLTPELAPHVPEEDVRALVQAMLGAFVGLVAQDLVDPDESSFNAAIRRFMALLEAMLDRGSAAGGDRAGAPALALVRDDS